MSDIICLLLDFVVNQIVVGEVIQCFVLVIKELVENVIDVGVQYVDVLVVDVGKIFIQVIDDGKGMLEIDVCLFFECYVIFKICEVVDLFVLYIMGFCGEVLVFIVVVVQVEFCICMEGEELGMMLMIFGFKVEGQEVVFCLKGSSFSVKNLFFNVLVCCKFLKLNQMELSNILMEFEWIVLVNLEVFFILYYNGVELFNFFVFQLCQCIMGVFGKKINQELLLLDVDIIMVCVFGFVGKFEIVCKKGVC